MRPSMLEKIIVAFKRAQSSVKRSWSSNHCREDHKCRVPIALYMRRVNSANFLDEGLRIGGRRRQINSKVKIRQIRRGLMYIENKRGTQLARSQSVPGWPLLAPLYMWPGLEGSVGFNTNYNVCIRCYLVFRLHLCLGLPNRPQGYQDNGPY
jgi:hypothetical protein